MLLEISESRGFLSIVIQYIPGVNHKLPFYGEKWAWLVASSVSAPVSCVCVCHEAGSDVSMNDGRLAEITEMASGE